MLLKEFETVGKADDAAENCSGTAVAGGCGNAAAATSLYPLDDALELGLNDVMEQSEEAASPVAEAKQAGRHRHNAGLRRMLRLWHGLPSACQVNMLALVLLANFSGGVQVQGS